MRKDLTSLALMGLTSGMLVSCGTPEEGKTGEESGVHQTQMTQEEQSFYRQLNAWGKKSFEQMNREQRAVVIQVAASGCHGRNDCKGLGGCKTEKNVCSGQNGCKGEGGCAASPNKAVELVRNRMAEKRSQL